jgi:hypothetical protein
MAGQYDKDRSDVNVAGRMHSWPQPGLNHVGQYQISGVPAVGSVASGETVTFERVTRAITVVSAVAATIDFNNTNQTAYTLRPDIPQRFEILAISMTVGGGLGPVNFVAELTGIQSSQCPDWDNTDDVLFEIA